MPESAFFFDELEAGRALEVLAAAGSDLALLVEAGLCVRPPDASALGADVRLVLPEPEARERGGRVRGGEAAARAEAAAALAALERALEALGEPTGRQAHGLEHEVLLRLPDALGWLLLHGDEEERSEPRSGDALILLLDERDPREVARLAEDLRFHATHVRWAALRTPDATRAHAFHVLDDTARHSSLGGLVAADALAGGLLLSGHDSSEGLVFTPRDRPPGVRALEAFARVARHVPVLSGAAQRAAAPGDGTPRAAASEERLAAVVSAPGEPAAVRLVPLRGLAFRDGSLLARAEAGPASVDVLRLEESAAAAEGLREAIDEAEPRVGYRLELRRRRRSAPGESERLRLHEKLVELEHELAYLNSLEHPRPTLLRFTQEQLPALADAIRSFPVEDVRDGRILHGFGSTADEPGGWHFLFFDPRATIMTEPYPAWRWRRLGAQPTRFALDPSWAEHAGGDGALLFVPEGHALFPRLDAWSAADVDAQVRAEIAAWFGEERAREIPARPVYVFDHQPVRAAADVAAASGPGSERAAASPAAVSQRLHPDARLRLLVLDRSGFQPLVTKLGWLNDNLRLLEELGVEELVAAVADDARRRDVAGLLSERARAAELELEAAAEGVTAAAAREAAELVSVLTEELSSIASVAAETHAQLRREHAELRRLAEVLSGVRTTRKELDDAAAASRDLVARFEILRGEIAGRLSALESGRQAVEARVTEQLTSLRHSRERLRSQLDSLRGGRGG